MALISPPDRHGLSSVRVKRPGEKRNVSRSAARALDVLEYFGEERRKLRAIEIAGRLHLSASTTNQLLKTMVDSGHLVFDIKGKTYLPSPRLMQFGRWLVDSYGVQEGLGDLVAALSARTGVSVTLTTVNDLFMQIVDLATMPGDSPERGLQVSVFGSAIGSAYLSTLSDEELSKLCRRARIPPGEVGAIKEKVTGIREDGFADGPSRDQAVWSIAVPFPQHGFEYRLVLALAGPIDLVRPRRDALLGEMRDAVSAWQARQDSGR